MRWCDRRLASACLVVVLGVGAAQAQPAPKPPAAAAEAAPAPPADDPLGRHTPRGTVLGFLAAARKGEDEIARQYLDTRADPAAGRALARQLFVVLDAKLPARLPQISDERTGSRANPLTPDVEVIGTVPGSRGEVAIVVERSTRGGQEPIWLFSNATLQAIPALHTEVTSQEVRRRLPDFLERQGIGGVRWFEWLVVLVGIPLFFVLAALLNRLLIVAVRPLWRRFSSDAGRPVTTVLPVSARLLLFALCSHWLLSAVPLSLRVRQYWSSAASALTIVSVVALLIVVNAELERIFLRRFSRGDTTAVAALLRILRRVADVVIVLFGLGVMLRYFGIDPTPTLAGVGVGGIAVALAAQKTLENIIAGASLIFDQAVKVGDYLKIGETEGTVDHIGLRSTRIRTPARTVVSIPNGQIASATLETVSARDKFWFHPEVHLRYDTTPTQLSRVLDGFRQLLASHPAVAREDQRVRLHRLGPFSFDIEIYAYVLARDWNGYLEIQEQLLFGITETVERAGTALALPSQMMYVGGQTPQNTATVER